MDDPMDDFDDSDFREITITCNQPAHDEQVTVGKFIRHESHGGDTFWNFHPIDGKQEMQWLVGDKLWTEKDGDISDAWVNTGLDETRERRVIECDCAVKIVMRTTGNSVPDGMYISVLNRLVDGGVQSIDMTRLAVLVNQLT